MAETFLTNEAGELVVPMRYTPGYDSVVLKEPKTIDLKTIKRHALAYRKQNGGQDIDEYTALEIAIVVLCTSHQLKVKDVDQWDAGDLMEVGKALNTFRVFKAYSQQ